jgi:hypothetical protein
VATLFADACELNFLKVSGPGVIDLGAFTSPKNYEEAVKKCLINDEVDSLLIGFACVGKCSTKPFESAIRDGVKSAEELTGKQKTVLLCLMGAEGTISIEDEKENHFRKFPAFRFPESAVHALARVVKYVEYRKKPSGRLVWYKNVNGGEARTLVQKELSTVITPHSIFEIEKNKVITLLDYFGIGYSDNPGKNIPLIGVRIKPDPVFGPLLELENPGLKSILRITPVTDKDVDEIITEMKIKEEKGIKDVLGRLSQMIEEIPWLWDFEAAIVAENEPLLTGKLLLTLKTGGAERPPY